MGYAGFWNDYPTTLPSLRVRYIWLYCVFENILTDGLVLCTISLKDRVCRFGCVCVYFWHIFRFIYDQMCILMSKCSDYVRKYFDVKKTRISA